MDYKDEYGRDEDNKNYEPFEPDENQNKDQYDTKDFTDEFSNEKYVNEFDEQHYSNEFDDEKYLNEPPLNRAPQPRRDGNYIYRGGSSYDGDEEYRKEKKKRFSILSLIAASLIFTLLGTTVGIFSAYNVLPGTAFYNQSKLGQLIEDRNSIPPAQVLTPELQEEGLTIPQIVSIVQPAVVTVTVQVPGGGGSLFNPEGGFSESIGTGFILNDEGLIATNYHVVERGENIRVILYTGQEATATVVNYDASNDLAVLQMDEDVRVPGTVTLGDSDNLRVGESVIAIGNPLSKDFAGTVTSGIVSATERSVIVGNTAYNYIQTDAAINGGNSGGPLINARGEVIGINSAKISTDSVEGIGFAIPINTLTAGLDTLSKAQLLVGIAGREINEATAAQNDIPQGVLVVEVQEDSPAYLAEMMVGDVIVEFDGEVVATVQEINEIKNTKEAGDEVLVRVYREGDYIDLNLTLIVRP